jgi:hypothetical protein
MLKPFADRYDSMRALVETALAFTVASMANRSRRCAAPPRMQAARAASGRSTGRWTNRIRRASASRVTRPSTSRACWATTSACTTTAAPVGARHRLLQPLPGRRHRAGAARLRHAAAVARSDRAPAVERRAAASASRPALAGSRACTTSIGDLAPARLRGPHVPRRRAARQAPRQTVQLRAGDYIVPLDQDKARYAVETLEPLGHDSFFRWGFFNSVLEKKEAYSDYVFEDEAEKHAARRAGTGRQVRRPGRPPIRNCCRTRKRCSTSSSPTARATANRNGAAIRSS